MPRDAPLVPRDGPRMPGDGQSPIDHGLPNHGFENGIINQLIHGIIQLDNGMDLIGNYKKL